jgi:transaldolase
MRTVVSNTAAKLEARYRASGGDQGYVCAQVDPTKAGDREAMRAMARRFHAWAPNIAVKLPVTAAGLDVLEECVAEGTTVTATVSFTVPQVLAVAERHRAGAARARRARITPGHCFAVIMIGRLDDYLREVAWDNAAGVSEADIQQAGLAVTKRAYELFMARGYEAVLLVAALRGTHHMTELAGARLLMSIHPQYQVLLLKPGVPREERIDRPVAPEAIDRLRQMPEFVRAYEPDGMAPEEFVAYGVTQRTLSQFNEAGWALLQSFDAF